jgi:hypothetical protein
MHIVNGEILVICGCKAKLVSIAKRMQQRRPRQADAFLFRPSVPRFEVCALEVSEIPSPCECFYAGLLVRCFLLCTY